MKNEVILNNNNLQINDLLERYLKYIDVSDNTTKTYNVGLKQFIQYLHDNNIKTPTREDIINFREYLKEEHKPNTINAYLIAVRNFYSWLEYEDITKDISKKIKGIKLENHHLKRGLSQEEIRNVLSVCKDKREQLLIKIMLTCALRINEVANMGRRELAYEIEKFNNGSYFLFKVTCDKEAVSEFDRVANINEDIIRHIVVKKEN